MAKQRKAVNRRKSGGGGRAPLLALIVVVAVIAAGLFLLERGTRLHPPKAVTEVKKPLHHKLPEREIPQPAEQRQLSSAAVAPEKPRAVAPPTVAAPAGHGTVAAPAGHGTVAVIVDDMGSSTAQVRELLSIHVPITFSVIPSLAKAGAVAEAAHGAGAEVMVHIPMEPQGYPKQPMEKIGLLVSMDDAEIEKRVQSFLSLVPHAVGANNHMGSRFTEDAEKMEAALRVLKGRGMYFVDSRTTPASVGYETARDLGMKCASRQVFLDNVQEEGAIGKQLAQAAALARKKGVAIAICHPHPSTIAVLKAKLPELARGGITFVRASALVR